MKYTKCVIIVLSIIFLILPVVIADELHKNILYPTVRIRSLRTMGSGMIFASIKDGDRFDTYILTNHHVIADSITIKEEWNSLKKRMEKKETRATIEVEQFKYQNLSVNTGTLLILGDIVEWNRDQDLGLIKLRSDEHFSPIRLLPKNKVNDIRIFEPVYICGAGNGRSPFPTFGIIASLQDEIENFLYWMVTAPSVFGNSGGGCFLSSGQEFIGIPARLGITFVGWSPNAVYHMNYIIPIPRIYNWLAETGWGFLYDPKAPDRNEWVKTNKNIKEN